MTTINSINNNDNQHSSLKNAAITTAGFTVGWEAQTLIGKYSKYPVRQYILSNIKEAQGDGFLPYVDKAIEQNNLKNDLKVIDLNKGNAEQVKQKLKVKFDKKMGKAEKIILHILRFPNNKNSFNATVNGKNAFFSPLDNAVVCNFKKFGAPIFHEIQHKLNSKSSNKFIKTLSKIRGPLAILGPLVISFFAISTNQKKDGEKQNLDDKIKKHCGVLTTLSILPLTIEECIANVKGTKVAKQAGVSGEMLKKVKTMHKWSIISYVSSAILAGIAAWGGNKIRDKICEYKTPEPKPQLR